MQPKDRERNQLILYQKVSEMKRKYHAFTVCFLLFGMTLLQAQFLKSFSQDGKVGFMNDQNEIVIEPLFSSRGQLMGNDVYPVTYDGKTGYIDARTGVLVFPFKYTVVTKVVGQRVFKVLEDGKFTTHYPIQNGRIPTKEMLAAMQQEELNKQDLNGEKAFEKAMEYSNKNNLAEAKKWYEISASRGQPVAMYNLGLMYYHGRGVPQNYAEAFHWYKKAADRGMMEAHFNVGVMYAKGQGVAVDFMEAKKSYEKAAEKGSAPAMFNLSLMYFWGEGIPKDEGLAFQWTRKAAEKEMPMALFNLGVLYEKGIGTAPDKTQTFKYYLKASEKEVVEAMYYLGLLYYNGEGVAQNYTESKKWIQKAADNDLQKAMDFLASHPFEPQSNPNEGISPYLERIMNTPVDKSVVEEQLENSKRLVESLTELPPEEQKEAAKQISKYLEDQRRIQQETAEKLRKANEEATKRMEQINN